MLPNVAPSTILLVLLVLAGALFLASPGRCNGFRAADYRLQWLLSRCELRVLAEINGQLPPGDHACPQVHLADLIEVALRDARSRHRSAINGVAAMSVDHVVIDTSGAVTSRLRRTGPVELDDRNHREMISRRGASETDRGRPERARQDREVDAVPGRRGVPPLRVRPGHAVQVRRLLAGHSLLGTA